jgi:hypothetical protein
MKFMPDPSAGNPLERPAEKHGEKEDFGRGVIYWALCGAIIWALLLVALA